MSVTDRPLSPHLQIYRWQITMLLSIMHRATGIVLFFGLVLLAGWLVAVSAGPENYTRLRDGLVSPPGLAVLLLITYAFCYHLSNGIRHLFWDVGVGFEKRQYRASGWAVVIVSIVLTALVAAVAGGVFAGAGA